MAILPEEVRSVTGSSLKDNAIKPFIVAAEHILGNISEYVTTISNEHKDQLETYLAAHLLTTSAVGQDSAAIAKESLNGKYSIEYLLPKASGQGILATIYGQTANALSNGCLAELDKRPVNVFSIGSL